MSGEPSLPPSLIYNLKTAGVHLREGKKKINKRTPGHVVLGISATSMPLIHKADFLTVLFWINASWLQVFGLTWRYRSARSRPENTTSNLLQGKVWSWSMSWLTEHKVHKEVALEIKIAVAFKECYYWRVVSIAACVAGFSIYVYLLKLQLVPCYLSHQLSVIVSLISKVDKHNQIKWWASPGLRSKNRLQTFLSFFKLKEGFSIYNLLRFHLAKTFPV